MAIFLPIAPHIALKSVSKIMKMLSHEAQAGHLTILGTALSMTTCKHVSLKAAGSTP